MMNTKQSLSSKRTNMRCSYLENTISISVIVLSFAFLCSQSPTAMAFSSDVVGRKTPLRCCRSSFLQQLIFASEQGNSQCGELRMTSSDFEDEKTNKFHEQARLNQNCHRTGRKRAQLRKYSKAIALSTALMYGPMASAPFARRSFIGSSNAHAAASTTSLVSSSGNSYNFQDFKDVKKKLSLAPGANVQAYEEILERVAVEGDDALQGMKPGEMEAALTIGGANVDSGESAAKDTGTQKIQKKQSKKQKVSEWESDEFGFGEDDDDDIDSGVLKIGSSSSSPSKVKGKAPSASGENSGKGDVVVTDKMAYNNYQAALSRKDHMKTIKKGAFYSIFPVFVITMIRGQVRAYREKKKVKRGLALFEQEKKDYIEERKKQGSKGEDDDDDDDDDQDDKPKDNKKGKK